MSLGYADRLSHREDLGGRLGDPELLDAPHTALGKAHKLAELIRDANKVVVFTGAGISTACGIPDFRGPQGVWTCQRKGLPPPKLQTSFLYAKPSLTHQSLLGLLQSGKLACICSQNVDSLHLRSGVPRSQLAELHGNCFAERCKKCKKEYVRDFEMDTVGFKPTGRRCTEPDCRGVLKDHILDWEDALPDDEFKATQKHSSSADVALCLGTSLQIIPAANLPLRTVKAGGKLAIINLQATPKDKRAEVVIHAKVDEIMAVIMQQLNLPIPQYTRTDHVLLSHTYTAGSNSSSSSSKTDNIKQDNSKRQQEVEAVQTPSAQQQQQQVGHDVATDNTEVVNGSGLPAAPVIPGPAAETPSSTAADKSAATDPDSLPNSSSSSSGSSWAFSFCISSIHGPACPLPMVASANVSFVGPAAETLKPREFSGQLPWRLSRTCPENLQEAKVQVTLHLVQEADADKRVHQLSYTILKPVKPPAAKPATRRAAATLQADASQVFDFVTQVVDYSDRQRELVQKLQVAAEQSQSTAPADAENAAAVSGSHGGEQRGSKSRQRSSSQGGGGSPYVDGSGSGGASAGTPSIAAQVNGASVVSEGIDGDLGSADDDIEAEPTGLEGQNSSGRARKRSKRLDI